MRLKESKLERFFARWEFSVEHVLCASDVESYALSDVLELADEELRERWDKLTLGHTTTTSDTDLRTEISNLYDTISPDEIIVCGGGAAEVLFLVLNALLGPDTQAAVVWPAFEPLYKPAYAAGADVTFVPLNASASWTLDLDILSNAIRPSTQAIVINFPHNPTGTILDQVTFHELIDLARQHGIPVVSDEVYRFIEFDPTHQLPAAADLDERSISVGVMSKAYGMPGLRIGWAASHDSDLLRRMVRIKDYMSPYSPTPSEILALIALRAHRDIVARCKKIVTENIVHVESFFARWQGLFDWRSPKGGPVGFPRLNAPIPVDHFVAELVKQEGVLLLPGTIFDYPENRFRIGLGKRSLTEAVERLDNFVDRNYAHFR